MTPALLKDALIAEYKIREGNGAFVADWIIGVTIFSFVLGTVLIPLFGDSSVGMFVTTGGWMLLLFGAFWLYTGGGAFLPRLERGLTLPFFTCLGGPLVMCAGFLLVRSVEGAAEWWDVALPLLCGIWFLYLGLHKGPVSKGELF